MDVGCGAARGGLHFIDYLEPGHYFGTDINASLLKAANIEVRNSGLLDKAPQFHLIDDFDLRTTNETFDYAISVSLFTHLPMNHIVMCIRNTVRALVPGGSYFSTWFESPRPAHLEDMLHQPGGITTHYGHDPYHLSFEEVQLLARLAGAGVERIGDWNHPRNQMMARFHRTEG